MDNFEKVLPKLLSNILFSDFNKDNEKDVDIMKQLYENMKLQTFKNGDIIIKEGDYGDLFYILYEGKVDISRTTPAGDTIALAKLSAEQNVFFGETSLISSDTRSATVKASGECKCITLSSKEFLNLCEKEPVLGYRVILHLAQRMAKTIRDTNRDKAALYEALCSEIEGDI